MLVFRGGAGSGQLLFHFLAGDMDSVCVGAVREIVTACERGWWETRPSFLDGRQAFCMSVPHLGRMLAPVVLGQTRSASTTAGCF